MELVRHPGEHELGYAVSECMWVSECGAVHAWHKINCHNILELAEWRRIALVRSFYLCYFFPRSSFMYKMRYTFRQSCRSWWLFFSSRFSIQLSFSILYINARSSSYTFFVAAPLLCTTNFLVHIHAPLVHHTSIRVAFYLTIVFHYEMRERAHTRTEHDGDGGGGKKKNKCIHTWTSARYRQ